MVILITIIIIIIIIIIIANLDCCKCLGVCVHITITVIKQFLKFLLQTQQQYFGKCFIVNLTTFAHGMADYITKVTVCLNKEKRKQHILGEVQHKHSIFGYSLFGG